MLKGAYPLSSETERILIVLFGASLKVGRSAVVKVGRSRLESSSGKVRLRFSEDNKL